MTFATAAACTIIVLATLLLGAAASWTLALAWVGARRVLASVVGAVAARAGVSVRFAERCAWRATYLYFRGREVAHVGVDPTSDGGPEVFAALGGRTLRRRVPCVRWRVGRGPVRLALYRRQQALLRRLDGRCSRRVAAGVRGGTHAAA